MAAACSAAPSGALLGAAPYGAAIAAPAAAYADPLWNSPARLLGKRSADPSLLAAQTSYPTTKCETITEKACTKVPVNTPKTIKVNKCTPVPKEQCKDVTNQVPENQCKDVTRKACQLVPKEVSN